MVEAPAEADAELLARLVRTDGEVILFPVRHHSPVASAMVRQVIAKRQPSAVLIEGPSDFNDQFAELTLDHTLPIAIYSYFQQEFTLPAAETGDDENRDAGDEPVEPPKHRVHSGAYYPFCAYSPEWAALRAAAAAGVPARFIDLPWVETAGEREITHRYGDASLRRSRYVEALCRRLQVEDFDDLWDRLIESHWDLTLEEYLTRTHSLCTNIRYWEAVAESDIESVEPLPQDEPLLTDVDRRREAFMAERVAEAVAARCDDDGPVLVVTGGFHSPAILRRLDAGDFELGSAQRVAAQPDEPDEMPSEITLRGIALTTYSFERLDGLTGYNSGMPSPGFYQEAWTQRQRASGQGSDRSFDHRPLLATLVKALRKRKQALSTADLIAVETCGRALAALRGRPHVWRRDLIDAVVSALVKDELEYGAPSPFVEAIHETLRGTQTGSLAAGTSRPPLVNDTLDRLQAAGFVMPATAKHELDLLDADGRDRSRLLHQIATLNLPGFSCERSPDFSRWDSLDDLSERWSQSRAPQFEAGLIEAARYGTTLPTAVAARLHEEAEAIQRDAAAAAGLLVRALRCGEAALSKKLLATLGELIRGSASFDEVAGAVGSLLYLYWYDEALGTTGLETLRELLGEALARSLWLLESLGASQQTSQTIGGIRAILETLRRGRDLPEVDVDEAVVVFARVRADDGKAPAVRGAAAGVLWTLDRATADDVRLDLIGLTDPEELGDYLTGLFSLGREVAQRHPELVRAIDGSLLAFDADQFLAALPSLRLAFMPFTPREKHLMLETLFGAAGRGDAAVVLQPLPSADEATAARALRIEERLFETLAYFGLEGGDGGL